MDAVSGKTRWLSMPQFVTAAARQTPCASSSSSRRFTAASSPALFISTFVPASSVRWSSG